MKHVMLSPCGVFTSDHHNLKTTPLAALELLDESHAKCTAFYVFVAHEIMCHPPPTQTFISFILSATFSAAGMFNFGPPSGAAPSFGLAGCFALTEIESLGNSLV